ncbi:AraC family transcriptional regulator [Streptomyces spiroverticillatus]|uniref:AraC family transcriptional regulator n=1 Tax=Streptomyces finlayi TaxID=67296 RepID=A0A918WZJ9_9ACTN|nr:AraC family transcriptional regulator [Streptomyces finlayi]GHA16483.1 AraC family transcriptional regulator [Streptomyces spiroverticillatus]GHC98686.1 AraC family transcriptional regulator [Streptomyces finlayi]
MDVVSDAIAVVRVGRPSSDRLRAYGSWCTRVEAHGGAAFHVVLEGACWLLPDGGDPLLLRAGDAVLLPQGTGHVLSASRVDPATAAAAVPLDRWLERRSAGVPARHEDDGTGTEMLCGKYRLDHSRTHPLLAELPEVVHLPNRVGEETELRSAIGLLGRELHFGRPGSCLAVPSLLDLLLVYMIRAWSAEGGAGTWSAVLDDPVTAAALRALHSDPAAPWTNDALAARAGVSRPTLARRFTALVGRPPMAYLTWWRLTLAATRLRDTDEPLAAVARQVGYATPYALSHAFAREFGTTPGRFREAARAR